MVWDHLSITNPHLVYIILGGFTSLFMLCSSVIKERMYIGEATVATLCGVIFGPHAANLINPLAWGNVDEVTLEFSRIVLVVQCFAVGVELPKFYMEKHWKSVAMLLVPVMTTGWLVTSLFVWWLIKPLNYLESLTVAACVTATDPVLASSVVGKGKFARRVPKHLRDVLSAESGCNDGTAFLFIYLAIYLIRDQQSAREVTFHWVVYTILYEIVFGSIFGFLVGYLARHAVKYAEQHDMMDRVSFLSFYFVLALFCAGAGSILGIDDLLVGFAAGVGFSNDGWFSEKTEESHVSNVIDLLLNLAYFVYFGTIIPWEDFNNASVGLHAWRLVVLAIFVILFRRIPIMMFLKPVIPDIKTWREALFAGHFGPIGVGAIFMAILARAELETHGPIPLSKLPPPDSPYYTAIALVWPVVCFLVVSSIIVHGSSIAVFTLGKHINTLTITMSYTHGSEDGPSWLNRLPRISSSSRLHQKPASGTDGEEVKMPQLPPGTLPPTGLVGAFLRRIHEDEPGTPGSRSSSPGPRWRRKKWDTGIGPGGPVSQSAIFPQPHPHTEPPAQTAPRHDMEPAALEEGRTPPVCAMPEQGVEESTPEAVAQLAAVEQALPELALQRTKSLEMYREGHNIVLEDQDGDVLAVQRVQGRSDSVATKTKALADELSSEAGPSGWTYAGLKQRVAKWREAELEKRKEQRPGKGEPARAFQFGNTVGLISGCFWLAPC
jgi:NhaP-type Na+/H+ or K+/H+ antiporter